MLSISVVAQTGETRERELARTNEALTPTAINEDPVVLSVASPADLKAAATFGAPTLAAAKFQQLMLAAIDQRLGARYRWGGTGPSGFDCSGFVWSTFRRLASIRARQCAALVVPVRNCDFEKKGSLELWSSSAICGISHRRDENGFYHASRHHGVSIPLHEYWLSRVEAPPRTAAGHANRRVPTSKS